MSREGVTVADKNKTKIDDIFFQLSSDLMCKVSSCGRLIYTSPAWEHVLGCSERELFNRVLSDLIHPDDVAIARPYFEHTNYLKGGLNNIQRKHVGFGQDCVQKVRFRMYMSNTGYAWLDWKIFWDTTSLCFFASATDVTEHNRKDSYLRKLMEVTKVGFWEIDLDTEKLYWSDEVHRIHETDPQCYFPNLSEAVRFYHPDSLPMLSSAVENQMLTGEPYDLELKFITSKGNHRWVRAVSHTEAQNDKIIRAYGTFEDITGKVAQRNETQTLKDRVELALRSSNIGVWEFDLQANNLVWDEQMYRLYGAKPGELGDAFATWKALLHPEDKLKALRAIDNIVKGETNATATEHFRIITPAQDLRYIAAMASVTFDSDGKALKLLGVNWDITEQETIKKELLRQKNLAEQSDTLKSIFISNMSHELRTPLNSIIGFSSRLLKRAENVEERTHRALLSINNNGYKLLSLVNDVLDLSKIDAGNLGLTYSSVSVPLFFGDLLNDFCDEIHAKGLTYHMHVDTDINMRLDESRCSQFMRHLMSNAIKFTHEGFIRVSIDCINGQDDEANQKFLRIQVEDSGVGIRPKDQLNVFKRFEQFDGNSQLTIGQGSGLGLAISYELVKMHGGNIEIESQLSKGSCFIVTLPILPTI